MDEETEAQEFIPVKEEASEVKPSISLIDQITKKESIENEEIKSIDENYASKFRNDVEVIDVKVVPKKGIPETKERKTWDQLK